MGTIAAIAGKELRSFLGNPTGYVFLTLFIALCAGAAFWPREFFDRNLADLATLNKQMPLILMLFVPAITMTLWADERRAGTDELLLTLPVRDTEVVLGKFVGAVGVLTIGLVFSLANVLVLAYLGEPDGGLMFATYFGYWLMGALFVAVGMVGSMFTGNTTVAFILGALGCAGLVFAGTAPWADGIVGCAAVAAIATLAWVTYKGTGEGAGYAAVFGGVIALIVWLTGSGGGFEETFAKLGVDQHFYGFGEGVVRLGDVAYFMGIAVVVLYLCTFMLGRRHW
jgi:ABC-2 type transport system permease protein